MRSDALRDDRAVARRTSRGRPDSALKHPPITARLLGRYLLAYVVLAGVLTGLGLAVVDGLDGTALSRTDERVANWFVEQRTAALDSWTEVGSAFSDTITVVIAATIVCLSTLLFGRRWHETVLIAGALLLEALVFMTSAKLVGRDRPDVEQLDVSPPTASFPSGHEGAAVAFYVGLAVVVFWQTRHRLARSLVVVLAVAIPVVVGLSRMYRGMHFFTDIVAGALLGLLAVVVAYQIVRLGTEHLAQRRADGDRRIPASVTRLAR